MKQKISRKDLMNVLISQNISMVEIKEVTLQPGQPTLRHFHPCPVLGYILSGSVRFQIEGEESKIIHQGEAFYEPKNKTILQFDNPSAKKPLIFVAFYLKEGNEEIIKILSD